jgi:hypothetical protein
VNRRRKVHEARLRAGAALRRSVRKLYAGAGRIWRSWTR